MAPVCSHYFHKPLCWGLLFYLQMQLLMEINGRFVFVEPAGPRINSALPVGGRRSCLPWMLHGLLEGRGLGFTLSTAASQNLGRWGELLGMGQFLLSHKSHFGCPIPGSSFIQLRKVLVVRFARQRGGVDGASLEDLVYDVLPRLLVLVP